MSDLAQATKCRICGFTVLVADCVDGIGPCCNNRKEVRTTGKDAESIGTEEAQEGERTAGSCMYPPDGATRTAETDSPDRAGQLELF